MEATATAAVASPPAPLPNLEAANMAAKFGGPQPLLLDAKGREIDASGHLVRHVPRSSLSILKTNQNYYKELEVEAKAQDQPEDITKSKYYDPRVVTPRVGRPRRDFNFVEHGTFIKKAEKMRAKAIQDELMKGTGVASPVSPIQIPSPMEEDFNPNLIAIGPKEEIKKPEDPIPDVEWWDAEILRNGKYEDIEVLDPKDAFVHDLWIYVEHPVPIAPPAEPAAPPALPLMLTKQERKKLRRRTRMEAQKDKQERILLGLEPPPPPKVKISNLMRVLMNEAVQDPTQIEKQVREQMEQRQRNHEMRNQARKLTKDERRAKKKKKLLEDAAREMTCALFRVADLSHPLLRAKVERCAQDNMLSGTVVLNSSMTLVVVEGGPKAIRKYKKLMLRRIKWDEQADEQNGENNTESTANGDPSSTGGLKKTNNCTLVWEGNILKSNFKHFIFETCPTEALARKYLLEHNVGHFWDMAKCME
jgi:U4/U6 small nuclear ribonucleoprotein PRP3